MSKLAVKYITKRQAMPASAEGDHEEHPVFWELCGVDLHVNAGEALGLVGDNGAGKSTLMQIMSGRITQTTGFVNGATRVNLASLTTIAPNVRRLPVGKWIERRMDAAEVDELQRPHIKQAILNFAELGQWQYCPVGRLETGLLARVALGLALFITPDVVLIDELLTLLDANFYAKTSVQINKLKKQGVAFVIADPQDRVIESFCERTVWLDFGRIREAGATPEVMTKYEFNRNWYRALSWPEQLAYIKKKQQEQLDFDVDTEYTRFKNEQFDKGYSIKDKARLRKRFFVEHGEDPLATPAETQAAQQKPKKKKKHHWGRWLLCLCVIGVLGCGAYWLSTHGGIFPLVRLMHHFR